jgi:hypothetical protein
MDDPQNAAQDILHLALIQTQSQHCGCGTSTAGVPVNITAFDDGAKAKASLAWMTGSSNRSISKEIHHSVDAQL